LIFNVKNKTKDGGSKANKLTEGKERKVTVGFRGGD
jgi:hypothetical protein